MCRASQARLPVISPTTAPGDKTWRSRLAAAEGPAPGCGVTSLAKLSQAPRPPAAPSLGFVSGSGGVIARCTGRVRVVLNNAPNAEDTGGPPRASALAATHVLHKTAFRVEKRALGCRSCGGLEEVR